jgi:predicted transcriptional regulator
MTLSVRLDDELDRLVQETARVLNRTRSEVVKLSLRDYCGRALRARDANPYSLAKDLLGRVGSGRGDLSVRGRDVVRELLDAKRSRRSC